MNPNSKYCRLLVLFVACFCFASLASASLVVVNRPGDLTGNPYQLGGQGDEAVAVSWTQDVAFQNLYIDVYNLQNFQTGVGENMTVNFVLRSGTLDGTLVGTGNALVLPGEISNGQPFTSLTLGAGTYFLIASATGFDGAWLEGVAALEETHAQAAFGAEYIRASGSPDFIDYTPVGVGYGVYGDLVNGGGGGAEIPEPGSWLLMGTGLLALGSFLRRR